MLDDLISTGTSMARVAAACRGRGSGNIHLAATHGVFPATLPPSAETSIASIVVTASIAPPRLDAQSIGGRLVVLSVASLFAEAISRSHTGGSIAQLLEGGD